MTWKVFLWYIAFGAAVGTAIFFLENIFGVSIPSWMRATIIGVAIFVFTLVFYKSRNVDRT